MIDITIEKRRSVRRFKNQQPAEAEIEKLLHAATLAPSASNKQPWRFHVITNKSKILSIAEQVKAKIDVLISDADVSFKSQFEEYSYNFICFQNAPVLIIPTFRPIAMLSLLFADSKTVISPEHIKKLEYDSSLISVSCAIQNLLLTAEERGLGACCMTGPLLAKDEICHYLSIPNGWSMAAIIAVGYPAEQPPVTDRKPISKVTKWLR